MQLQSYVATSSVAACVRTNDELLAGESDQLRDGLAAVQEILRPPVQIGDRRCRSNAKVVIERCEDILEMNGALDGFFSVTVG